MKKGLSYIFAAYILWGFFPIFFKLLQTVPAIQIMTHRVTWSFVFLLLIVIYRKEFKQLVKSINKKTLLTYGLAGILLSLNWLTYIWGINAGYVVEAALGYFINPLVSVVLGVVFLHEKLRGLQWVPVVLATIGVIYLTIEHGTLPWIALVLAFTFGIYGLIKKLVKLSSVHGLTIETGVVLIPAVIYLIFMETNGTGAFIHDGWLISILLMVSGVITAIPLILFAAGATVVPLSTIGIIQYIMPTMQFLIGVFIYHEPFNSAQLIGYSLVWIALIFFTMEDILHRRRVNHIQQSFETSR
mgnify:CR=1 FL=1